MAWPLRDSHISVYEEQSQPIQEQQSSAKEGQLELSQCGTVIALPMKDSHSPNNEGQSHFSQ